jgi:hypothetical protein
MDELHPWDRQAEEPNRWYQRFTAFRLQGSERSVEATWRQVANSNGKKRPGSSWNSNSNKWHWNDRAQAWDNYLSEKANAEKEAAFIARHMGKNEVIAGLADIARGDMVKDFMDVTTSGFTIQLMTEDEDGNRIIRPNTKLIKKIRQKVTTYLGKKEDDEDREVVETEIELYSAHDAYRDLGKMHGLFVDRSEVTITEPVKFVEVELPPEEENVSDATD